MQQTLDETPHAGTVDTRHRRPAVLVIDASAPARYGLRLELRALGAAVRQVGSVEQALPALDEQHPDLIITAPVLPGMNALELLAVLRARSSSPAPLLVIHCANSPWPLADVAEAYGATAVLGTAELRCRLPALLRDAVKPRGVPHVAAARAGQAGAFADRQAPTRDAAASDARLRHADGTDACRRAVLVAALLGVVTGVWIASVLWL
jgi:CheY-like chemotaxis protein